MKDRLALSMIEGAERDALLEPVTTVVEYTGGSTGPALALVCRAKGYPVRIVIADCFSEERLQLMRALGAELEVIPSVEGPGRVTSQDIENMVKRAAELAREPGAYATDQFNNPYVIAGLRETLGREIWEQTSGRVTAFCHGIGTASSLMGVSEALKTHDDTDPHRRARARRLCGDHRWRRERVVRDAGLDRTGAAALRSLARRRGFGDRERGGDRDDRAARPGRGDLRGARVGRTSSALDAWPKSSAPSRSSSRSRSTAASST